MISTIIAYSLLFLSTILFSKRPRLSTDDKYNISNAHNYCGIGILYILIYSFIVGLRYDVGVDYLSYKNIFDQFVIYSPETPSNIQYIEPAFVLIYRILAYIGLPYYSFFIIVAFLNVTALYIFAQRYRNVTIWIFFFYISSMTLFETFNIMRQMTAFFFFLCTLRYIEKQNFLKYLISISVVSLFHISIFLMLPCYFFAKRRILGNSVLAAMMLCFFFVFKNQIIFFVWEIFFPSLSKFLVGADASYYLLKTDDLFYESRSNSLGIMHFVILFFDLLIIINISKMRKFYKNYPIDIFYNLFFIGACIYFISDGSIALIRLNTYFYNFLFIMLAFLAHFLSKTKSRLRIGYLNINLIYCVILVVLSNCIYINAIVNGTKNAPFRFIYEQPG